jgi:hypothetical protein
MNTSNMGSAPAELRRKESASDCGPMLQQSALRAQGYEMHPQEFVRLIGCRDTRRHKEETPNG